MHPHVIQCINTGATGTGEASGRVHGDDKATGQAGEDVAGLTSVASSILMIENQGKFCGALQMNTSNLPIVVHLEAGERRRSNLKIY